MPLQQAQAQPPTRSTGPCSSIDFYWKHVYYPGRLSEIKNCITVTGKVYSSSGTKEDPDGDLHFTLQLDPQFANKGYSIPNECNPAAKDCTNIIVEVICHSTPSSDYKTKWGDYCKGVQSKTLPNIKPSQGEHLSVSGKLVLDKDNKWNEIHPASDVQKIP